MDYCDLASKWGDCPVTIAKKLNVSRQLVAHWKRAGISPVRQVWIQSVTRGKFKANGKRQPKAA
jgi:hypothetical protein